MEKQILSPKQLEVLEELYDYVTYLMEKFRVYSYKWTDSEGNKIEKGVSYVHQKINHSKTSRYYYKGNRELFNLLHTLYKKDEGKDKKIQTLPKGYHIVNIVSGGSHSYKRIFLN